MTAVDEQRIEAKVAGLQVEVGALHEAVDRNTDSLADARESLQRLRGEINGSLPRIEKKIDGLATQVAGKADAAGNAGEHDRLWLALRLFFLGTLVGLLGLLLEKVLR